MTRTGIKVGLDVNELVANAGRAAGALDAITAAMKKAKKEGRDDDYGILAYEKERLQGRNNGFEKDVRRLTDNPRFQTKDANGNTVFKIDGEYAGLIKDQIAAMKRLTIEYEEAVKKGDLTAAHELFPQIEKQQADFHKTVDQAAAPTGMQSMQNAVKAIGFNQIAGAFNDALSRVVNSLDRSAIVNQYGSGDIMGGRISEKRRQADLAGGLLQTGLTIGGGILGGIFGGGPAGAIAGGSAGSAAGQALNTLIHGPANAEATEAAYADLWQSRSGDAMELAALTGSVNDVRGAFKTAADAAAEFGYSAEEGMDAMKQAAQQGLGGDEARAVVEQSFDYERRTGADRGTLLGISSMSARYGAGDALGGGWAGMQASGMKPGQYSEYLRAMQRVMEDGISKGFSKSAKEIAGDLTFIQGLSGGSELWKGEQGQQRLSQMSAGLEAATGLASSSDILAYRGARNVLDNDTDGKIWNQIANLDGKEGADIKRSGSYIDAMILMERGLNADTFSEIMKLNRNAEGGDRSAVIERMKQQFGLSYTNSAMLHDQWAEKTENGTKAMSAEDSQALVDLYGKEPPPPNSPEFDAAKATQAIVNWWTKTGISHWDKNFPKTLAEELANAIRGYNKETGSSEPVPGEKPVIPITDDMTPAERYDAAEQNAITLNDRGDYAGAEHATAEWRKAEMDILRQNQDNFSIAAKANTFAGRLYSPSIFSGQSKENRDADRTANTGFLNIFSNALSSGDESQIGKAREAVGILDAFPKDVLRQMDKDQSANRLGNAKDIDELIVLLRQIVNNTGETADNTGNINIIEETH
jgi:hypothetical protein